MGGGAVGRGEGVPGRVAANVDDLGQKPGGDEHADAVDAGERRARLLNELGDLGAQADQLGVDLDHPLQPATGHRGPDALVVLQQR
jgi:hypothetical protein